jgi:Tfp pilus assembly protein PilX
MKTRAISFEPKGIALVAVLGVVTLATLLVITLLSLADSEAKSSRSYSDGASARLLAENAVEIVKSQIQSGSTGADTGAVRYLGFAAGSYS